MMSKLRLKALGGGDGSWAKARRTAAALGDRARAVSERFRVRADIRRAAVFQRRTDALARELASSTTVEDAGDAPDLTATMRVAWQLVAALRATLLSLEERATRVVPAEVAGLIALWTQLNTFDRGAARIFVWSAWITLVGAVLVLARLVMPSRLDRFWDSLVPPEVILDELKPLDPRHEASLATQMSSAIHTQIERLRQGFRIAVTMSGIALTFTAIGYMIERW